MMKRPKMVRRAKDIQKTTACATNSDPYWHWRKFFANCFDIVSSVLKLWIAKDSEFRHKNDFRLFFLQNLRARTQKSFYLFRRRIIMRISLFRQQCKGVKICWGLQANLKLNREGEAQMILRVSMFSGVQKSIFHRIFGAKQLCH